MPIDSQCLRVLHLTAGSDAGGLSQYIINLSTAMRAEGHEIVAIAGEHGAWQSHFEAASLPWLQVPLKGGPIALWQAARTLRRFLQSHAIDIIHSHYRRPNLVARRLQRYCNVPLLYTVHQPRIALTGVWQWFSDFGDHTLVPSEDARRWLIDDAHLAPDRITVIPHGIDAARYLQRDAAAKSAARAALNLLPTTTVAAFVGRLDVPKNADWMLDVAIASRAVLPDLKVVLVGDGPDAPMIRHRIAAEGLADRVMLLGDCDPLPVYQAADALLSPSQREGFSLACGEAMSVGLPVLRTRTGGAAEMVIEGKTGRIVPVDRKVFVAAAVDFLTDRQSLQAMGENAARHVRDHFKFDRQVRETVQLYRKLIARRARRIE